MQGKTVSSLKATSQDLALMARKFMNYALRGDTDGDKMATPDDVELNLKLFNTVQGWFDKTVNKHGNAAALIDSLSDRDKDFLIELTSLDETEKKKFKQP